MSANSSGTRSRRSLTITAVGRPDDRLPWRSVGLGLAYAAGLAALSGLLVPSGATAVELVETVPGWGPVVVVAGAGLQLTAVPFQLIGYLGLGYLLARGLRQTTTALAGGVLGLTACVGCLVSTVVAGLSALGFGGVVAVPVTYTTATVGFIAATFVLVVKRLEPTAR